jgi:hypothetical protein
MPQQGMTDLSRLRKRPLEADAATSARAAGEIDIAGAKRSLIREEQRFNLRQVNHLRLTIVPNKSGSGTATLTQQSFGPHRRPWLRAPIMLVIGGWGRPILLPAALQLSDRHT